MHKKIALIALAFLSLLPFWCSLFGKKPLRPAGTKGRESIIKPQKYRTLRFDLNALRPAGRFFRHTSLLVYLRRP